MLFPKFAMIAILYTEGIWNFLFINIYPNIGVLLPAFLYAESSSAC